jgi:hypothetical protein
MCDYSLQNVKSRPAKIGDKLTTRNFGTGTRGFAASEDANVAVCVLPGTELSFSGAVTCETTGLLPWRNRVMRRTTAIRYTKSPLPRRSVQNENDRPRDAGPLRGCIATQRCPLLA